MGDSPLLSSPLLSSPWSLLFSSLLSHLDGSNVSALPPSFRGALPPTVFLAPRSLLRPFFAVLGSQTLIPRLTGILHPHAARIDTHHHGLPAVDARDLLDGCAAVQDLPGVTVLFGYLHRVAADGDFIGPTPKIRGGDLQGRIVPPVGVREAPDATPDREGNKTALRGLIIGGVGVGVGVGEGVGVGVGVGEGVGYSPSSAGPSSTAITYPPSWAAPTRSSGR